MTTAAPPASPAPPQVLLAHHLRQLKLPTFLREYDKVAAEAAREGLDHVRFLLRLAELELIDRERRMVERRIRAAHFPAVKSFDTFAFTAIPSLNKPLTLELARCEYLIARENVAAWTVGAPRQSIKVPNRPVPRLGDLMTIFCPCRLIRRREAPGPWPPSSSIGPNFRAFARPMERILVQAAMTCIQRL
jgi:IstB-like ATP binding protein